MGKALPFDLFPSAIGTEEVRFINSNLIPFLIRFNRHICGQHLWEPGPVTHELVFPVPNFD